jgi:hypothetical protein
MDEKAGTKQCHTSNQIAKNFLGCGWIQCYITSSRSSDLLLALETSLRGICVQRSRYDPATEFELFRYYAQWLREDEQSMFKSDQKFRKRLETMKSTKKSVPSTFSNGARALHGNAGGPGLLRTSPLQHKIHY